MAEHANYLTALLNSRLAWDWFRNNAKHRGVGLDINGHVLRRFPVRRIRWDDPAERQQHDALAALAAEAALAAQTSAASLASLGAQRAEMESAARGRFDALDAEIDRLVQSLYGVSDGEATCSRLRQKL